MASKDLWSEKHDSSNKNSLTDDMESSETILKVTPQQLPSKAAKASKSTSPRAEAAIRGGTGNGNGLDSSSSLGYQDDGTGVIIMAGLSLAICAICVLAGPVKVLQSVGSLLVQFFFICIPFLLSKVAPSAANSFRNLLSSIGFRRQLSIDSRQKDIDDDQDTNEDDENDERTQLHSVRVGSPSRSPTRSGNGILNTNSGVDTNDKNKHHPARSMKLGGKKGLVNINSSSTTMNASSYSSSSSSSSSSPTKDSNSKWEVVGSNIDDDVTIGSSSYGNRISTIARRGTSPAPAPVVSQVKVQRPNNGWAIDNEEELEDLLPNTTTTTTTTTTTGTASKNKNNDGWGNEEW
jgi:hypothetical protein